MKNYTLRFGPQQTTKKQPVPQKGRRQHAENGLAEKEKIVEEKAINKYNPCPPNGPYCPPTGPYCPPVVPYTPTPPQYSVPPSYPEYLPRLAHAYVPWQYYNVVYSPQEALQKGTLFPELYQPQGVYGPCEGPQPCHTYFPQGGVPYGCY